ncbi:hypothetical protein C2G38_2046542 [Gigaspora rosea]|uniref:SWIM-type domain-containing protein n=1 Tax=Gigaspora rosea TaxID=44941 RepID=A0A397UDB6_9GLOM|nr:hypothetical protein C2G38_2046542 [Gigaspora rosea]
MDKILFKNNEAQGLFKMIEKFAAKHMISILPDYYLVNYITAECTCFDFIWHGSFHNFCKHGYAARIYMSIKAYESSINEVKKELVQYFRNKERILAHNIKNNIIYSGSDEEAYAEILYQYQKNGYDIFLPIKKQIIEKDPFRPSELPRQRRTVIDLPEINNNNTTIDNNRLNNYADGIIVSDEDINLSVLNEDSPAILVEDYQYQDAKLVPDIDNDGISESLSTSSIQFKSNNIDNNNIPYSIEQRHAKRTQNNKRKPALGYSNLYKENSESVPLSQQKKIENSALKKLFEEQSIDWNRKEFAKECNLRNIRLDDDDIVNATKIISWFDRKKNKTKACSMILDT